MLVNEKGSIFTIDEIISHRNASSDINKNRLKEFIIPSISRNIKAKEEYEKFAGLLLKQSASPRILVIGGKVKGQGMESFAHNAAFNLVETDISFGPRTMLICDGHDIPFGDKTFDGVILQAVLEYVVDPYRCVEEAHRVLKDQGIIYAEAPFIQQVHGGSMILRVLRIWGCGASSGSSKKSIAGRCAVLGWPLHGLTNISC